MSKMKNANEIRVLGPPGTGKTTYLSNKIEEAASKVGGEQILVSSFTKAAAKELLSRDLPIPQQNIGTLHALCYRALGRPEIAETKINIFNEENPGFELSERSVDTSVGLADQVYKSKRDKNNKDKVFAEYQIMRAKLKPETSWKLTIKTIHRKWSEFKEKYDLMDFTDIIEKGCNVLKFPPNNTTIGIIDEVQDLTPLQMKLVRQWGEKMNWLMLSGDNDQLLFSFAGATPEAFMNPAVIPKETRVLDQSYRIPRAVHPFAEKWIKQIKNRTEREYKPRDFEGQFRSLRRASIGRPEYLIEDAARQIQDGKTVMILVTCGYMLDKTILQLKIEGIPFSNLFRTRDRKWNPLLASKGTSIKDRLLAYVEPTGPWFANKQVWTAEQLSLWTPLLKSKGILKRGSKKKLQELEEVNDDQQLLQIIAESFEPDALDQAIKCDPIWLKDNITGQYRDSIKFPLRILQRGKERFNESSLLTVGTIHSVKGGGRDVVYLAPDLSIEAYRKYQWTHSESFNSIIRTMYVGMTRCKQQLVLLQPSSNLAVKGLT